MFSIVFMIALTATTCAVSAFAEDADLARVFRSTNVSGAMVIRSADGRTTYVHNDARAHTRFLPASTFKIPNTLIALEEGAVRDEKQVIRWDGKDRGVPAWNKDQSLETAFPSSCVWFYQELAKRIGMPTYVSYLNAMRYGNARPGPEVTTFWLSGDLRISAMEQITFLEGLAALAYRFRHSSYEVLRRLMAVSEGPGYTIRAKSGWAPDQEVGWFVGYLETGNTRWFFATNLDIKQFEDNRLRQEVTFEALKIKGIL